MKILYIVTTRMPTEKAHGFQISKVCEKLAKTGADVTLWFPEQGFKRKPAGDDIDKNIFDFYGIEKKFTAVSVPFAFDSFVRMCVKTSSFYIRSFFFFLALLFKTVPREVCIITRSPEVAFLFGLKGNKVFYYAHNWPESRRELFVFLLKKITGVITNSNGTAAQFEANKIGPIHVAYNGVDLEDFTEVEKTNFNRASLRNELQLPQDRKILLYAGHLYAWKGVDVVLETAEKMAKAAAAGGGDVLFVLVGGMSDDVVKYRARVVDRNLKNVLVLGHKEKKLIPQYLMSADVLLLPNVPVSEESTRYTSPIKMFEYMASGTAIIASDLPSLREVLNPENAVLIPAGDASALQEAISVVLGDPMKSRTLTQRAAADVRKYTWDAQAKSIYNFLAKFS